MALTPEQTQLQTRLNTDPNGRGYAAPIWLGRPVLPGASTEGDSCRIGLRGDAD